MYTPPVRNENRRAAPLRYHPEPLDTLSALLPNKGARRFSVLQRRKKYNCSMAAGKIAVVPIHFSLLLTAMAIAPIRDACQGFRGVHPGETTTVSGEKPSAETGPGMTVPNS